MSITCKRCGTINPSDAIRCKKCQGSLTFVPEAMQPPTQRSPVQRGGSLTLTTTDSIQGRTITEYIDVVAAEVLQDSHFEFRSGRGITDVVGATSRIFETAFGEVRERALLRLREEAVRLNADAVVGLRIDYAPVSSSLVMAAARGTAVKLSPSKGQSATIPDSTVHE
jgi:uncharacterized protein YbjQ (UPF0145 family)